MNGQANSNSPFSIFNSQLLQVLETEGGMRGRFLIPLFCGWNKEPSPHSIHFRYFFAFLDIALVSVSNWAPMNAPTFCKTWVA